MKKVSLFLGLVLLLSNEINFCLIDPPVESKDSKYQDHDEKLKKLKLLLEVMVKQCYIDPMKPREKRLSRLNNCFEIQSLLEDMGSEIKEYKRWHFWDCKELGRLY